MFVDCKLKLIHGQLQIPSGYLRSDNHRPVGLWALNSVQDILGWVLKQIACDLLPDCTEGQLRTAGIQKPGQVNQEQVGNTNLRKSCFLGLRTYNLQF